MHLQDIDTVEGEKRINLEVNVLRYRHVRMYWQGKGIYTGRQQDIGESYSVCVLQIARVLLVLAGEGSRIAMPMRGSGTVGGRLVQWSNNAAEINSAGKGI